MVTARKKEVKDFFDSRTYARGCDYYKSGKVVSFTQKRDDYYCGRVQGARPAPYDVNLYVITTGREISGIESGCSCPIGYRCKHVVALLLAVMESEAKTRSASDMPELASAWVSWLASVDEECQKPQSAPSSALVYLLGKAKYGGRPTISIRLGVANFLKSGKLGKPKLTDLYSVNFLRHASDSDALLTHKLQKASLTSYGFYNLEGTNALLVLPTLVRTGRLYFEHLQIVEGPVRELYCSWDLCNNATQKLELSVEGGAKVLPSSPPWYLDEETGECGPLETDIDSSLFPGILNIPLAPIDQIKPIQKALEKKFPNQRALQPKPVKTKKMSAKPKPCLRLYGGSEAIFAEFDRALCLAHFSFRYDDINVPFGKSVEKTIVGQENALTVLDRDLIAESQYVNTLNETYMFTPLCHTRYAKDLFRGYEYELLIGDEDWSDLECSSYLKDSLSQLKQKGWEITIDDSFPFEWVDASESDWYLDLNQESQMQWFNLSIGIDIDGEKINILPHLMELLKNNSFLTLSDIQDDESFPIQLSPSHHCFIRFGRFKSILKTLCELQDPQSLSDEGLLKLPRLRAPEIMDLIDADPFKVSGADQLQAFAKRLKDFKGVQHTNPPSSFTAILRPYQQEGLDWLQFLSNHQIGGILADDMGLGKTVQTLAHLCTEKQKGITKPSLIIAPTSLMDNWENEAKRFASSLKCLILHGPDRKTSFKNIPRSDLVVTTYPLVLRDCKELLSHDYHALILDEAQVIKNPKSKVSKLCREFSANHRICLTGTPMENHLGELWSLFDFLNPYLLGNERQFKSLFKTPIEKHNRIDLYKNLTKRIAPFMLRRNKTEVAQELPPKTEMVRSIELEGDQRDLYESIRLAMQKKVKKALEKKGLASSQIIILDALLKLRQTCCDPSLLKLDSSKNVRHSAKMAELSKMLEQLIQEERKILLFSSFTSMLSIIEDHLKQQGYSYTKLTGKTKDRKSAIQKFQEGNASVFLISLKAGGVGLNLTAADTVIHYDPWWNPAAENQATDRAYRIGQDKPVFVYKLISSKTVEEKILKLQEKKQALMESLFSENTQSKSGLCIEDLEYLFEPIE